MPATLIVANLRSGGGRARDALPLVTNALRRHGREYELIVAPTGEATAPLLAEFLGASRMAFDEVAVIGGGGAIHRGGHRSLAGGAAPPPRPPPPGPRGGDRPPPGPPPEPREGAA